MIPSFKHGIIASSRPRVVAAGGGGDVTPDAISWSSGGIYQFGQAIGDIDFHAMSRQITGINTTVTLRIDYASPNYTVYYYVSSSPPAFMTSATSGATLLENPHAFYGMTAISSGGTFTVTNNQYIVLSAYFSNTISDSVFVRNQSDGDALLNSIIAFYDP